MKLLKKIWEDATGTDTVKAWNQKWSMPAAWALPELSAHFSALLSVERNERVDISCLDNAILSLQNTSLSDLNDKSTLDMKFVENVSSEKNKDLLLPHIDDLKKYLVKNYPYPSSWQSNIINIRKSVEKYVHENLKDEVGDKAKAKASQYSEKKLREMMDKILDNCIDACSIVLDE